jgi:hypothetical protein
MGNVGSVATTTPRRFEMSKREYLSKEAVAAQMRELANNIKNAEISVEIKDLADRVEEHGDDED